MRQHMVPQWRCFALGGVCALLTAGAAVSYGGLIKLLGDMLQGLVESAGAAGARAPDAAHIWILTGLIVAAAVIRALSLYGMTLLNNIGVQRALVTISNHQYSALMLGDYRRLADKNSGGFVSRFVHDLNTLRDAGLRLANNATKSILTLFGALCAMVWMDWQLALILLIIYPIAFGPIVALGNRVRKQARRSQEQMEEVTSLLSEGFQSARTVRAYGLEAYQSEAASKGFRLRANLFLSVLKSKAGVDPILEVAGGLAIAGVLGFSAWRIAGGASTIGDFLGFVALIAVAAPEARALGGLSALAQEASAAATRFYALVDAPNPMMQNADAASTLEVRGSIRFDGVDFSYAESEVERAALSGLDLEIKAGERVAIVGPSGAGKSTLFNLILRLYDPDKGRVLIDDIALEDIGLLAVRRQIALVEQDPILFDDTIGANIRLGDLGASDAEIVAAAKLANAHEFIDAMPAHYDTVVGERGGKLSGGQRQRIALARAFLRDAPILLLDEATSALDAESEAAVRVGLENYCNDGRTVLVIAHQLSTVRWVDRIIVLDAGQVCEIGSHEDLLGAGGLYAQLWGNLGG